MKKVLTENPQYSQENTSEYCKIFKNTCFEEHLSVAASVVLETISFAEK